MTDLLGARGTHLPWEMPLLPPSACDCVAAPAGDTALPGPGSGSSFPQHMGVSQRRPHGPETTLSPVLSTKNLFLMGCVCPNPSPSESQAHLPLPSQRQTRFPLLPLNGRSVLCPSSMGRRLLPNALPERLPYKAARMWSIPRFENNSLLQGSPSCKGHFSG